MRTVSAISRYLAGVIFLVFGLNGFLNFIPLPPPGGIAGQFMGALYASHYLCVSAGIKHPQFCQVCRPAVAATWAETR
jgi:hypothetical protein